jgi:predicted O-methyltransferase YrrM
MNAHISNINCVYVKGDVLKTLKDRGNLPKSISILRLDTDWYDSTRIELEVLYPLLTPGGIIIIDDYGHWSGARSAVDEFFSKQEIKPFFSYIDYTGRVGIKPHNS